MSMDDVDRDNRGGVIEGFVAGSYSVIYGQSIEVRNHPIASWAQATLSRSQHNFDKTQERLVETAEGLSKTLYDRGDDTHAANLSALISNLQKSQSPLEAGDHILDAKPWLDEILPVVDVDSFFPNPSKTL